MDTQTDLIAREEDESLGERVKHRNQYHWIIDDGLLRDEGVIFGFTNGDIKTKLDSIREYYNIRKADIRKELSVFSDRMKEFEIKDQNFLKSIDNLKIEIETKSPLIVINYPIVFQVFVYVLVALANYSLVKFWLKEFFQTDWVIVGLYLLGLFNVFSTRGLIFRSTSDMFEQNTYVQGRESWKIWFEELVAPIIVSGFIAIVGGTGQPLIFSVSIFFVLSLLFIFTGKGLVSLIFISFNSFKSLAEKTALLRRKRNVKRELGLINQEYKSFLMEYAQSKAEHMKNEMLLRTAIEKIDAEEKYRVSLFMSEFELARKASERMSGTQIQSFKR